MSVSKDVYGHITMFTDEQTTLNMLSVNKKFVNEEYYQRVIERKYSHLVKWKGKIRRVNKRELNYKMNWRMFYIKNMHYMLKIQKIYDVPYFNMVCIPENFLFSISKTRHPYKWILEKALSSGNEIAVNLLLNKKLCILDKYSLSYACESLQLPFIKKIHSHKIPHDFYRCVTAIKTCNRLDIIQFLVEKMKPEKEELEKVLLAICQYASINIIKYFIEKGAYNIQQCINETNDRIIKAEKYPKENFFYLMHGYLNHQREILNFFIKNFY